MKKIEFTLIMLLAGLLNTFAQQTSVTGLLLDSISQQPEMYATIRIYKIDKQDQPISMGITDMEGHISQEVTGEGEFNMLISSVGKTDINKHFTLNGEKKLDLGTILITDDVQMLGAVEIVAHKPLVKMEADKMSYDVQEDVDSKSNTVLELLRKVPMVTVDGQNNITVNGSSSFKVYVNGKPNTMMSSNPKQVFRSMPASNIKSIEVVTNPGARYDAEGVGGVLNIIMKQTKFNENEGHQYTGNLRVSYGSTEKGISAFVSGQKGRFNYSLNLMSEQMNSKNTETETTQEQLDKAGKTTIYSYDKSDMKFPFKMGELSLGYELDSMSSINASLSYTAFKMKQNSNPLTRITGGYSGSGFEYLNRSFLQERESSLDINLNYQRFLNSSRTSNILLTYMLATAPTKTKQQSLFEKNGSTLIDLTDRYSDAKENNTEHTLQADYTTPLSEHQLLTTGVKYVNSKNTSDAAYFTKQGETFVKDNQNSLNYHYLNNILAGYAEYDGTFGKLNIKGGLRYEHTWQDVKYLAGMGQNFTKSYGHLVPTASAVLNIYEGQNIGLNYNMRINRPVISQLDPYVNRTDPTSISYGNTNLDVEKTHNMNMVYNLFNTKFSLNITLRHSICNNAIEQHSFYQDNLLNTTFGNIVKRRQSGLNLYLNWSMTKSTRVIVNGEVTYTDLRSKALDTKNHGWSGSLMLGVQQNLPWNMKLSTNLITSTKQYNLQGWESGFNMLDASLDKAFFKDKLHVTLSAETGIGHGGAMNMTLFSKGKDFETTQRMRIPLQQISIAVSFNFGSKAKPNNVAKEISSQPGTTNILQKVSRR